MSFKKRTFIVLTCIGLGFLCSFFLFRLLTNKKSQLSSNLQSSFSAVKQEVSRTKPLPDAKIKVTEAAKDISSKVNIKEQISKDKESVGKKGLPKNGESVQKEFPPLMLKGIYYSEDGSLALINDSIVREGDNILGAKVSRIYPTRVEMDLDGQKLILRTK